MDCNFILWHWERILASRCRSGKVERVGEDHGVDVEIGHCGAGDYDGVLTIYNHYVSTSPATFDVLPFSLAARAPWFGQFAETGPYRLLVARNGNAVIGYCCSTAFKSRPAYLQSIETTVYVAAEQTGHGVGRLLYGQLFDQLQGQGLHRAYAHVALPNDASLRLHESFGFEQAGVLREVGFKFDTYWDVAILEKPL